MGDVGASMATVPSRTGDGRPVRPPIAMPASGFGVVGRTVATPRLVAVMWEQLGVVVVSAGSLESASFLDGFIDSATQ